MAGEDRLAIVRLSVSVQRKYPRTALALVLGAETVSGQDDVNNPQ